MATNTNEPARSLMSLDRALLLSEALAPSGTPAAQNTATHGTPRSDAIGIEIPVALYASRYSAAGRGVSKTPPPVREETRTVIVFAQGAVVRLTATLAVGEMVVLTNQQTGADVLCRVAAVKTQPGVQNYVDLEFTQRAPGFWEDSLAPGASARSESLAPAPPQVPALTLPHIQAPRAKEDAGSPSWLRTDSVPASASLGSGATPVSRPASAAVPSTPFAIESPRPSSVSAGSVVSPTSNPVMGLSAGMRLSQSAPLTLAGSPVNWTTQNPPKSKKPLWAAVAAVGVASLLAGGFLLSRRGPAVSPAAAITVAATSTAVSPAVAAPANEPEAPAVSRLAPSTTVSSAEAPRWVPETPKHEQPQAEQPPAVAVAQPAPESASAAASLRRAIPLGNLAAPMAKKPVMASLSEPPPVLVTQDTSADGVLRTGVLSGASRVEAPTAFAGAVTSPVHPIGGRIQMPKLISSPDPVYPVAARTQSAEGVVSMQALVDVTGKITEVNVISGPFVLRQAAIDAVRKWKYEPAQLDGQPTAVHTNVNISFKLH